MCRGSAEEEPRVFREPVEGKDDSELRQWRLNVQVEMCESPTGIHSFIHLPIFTEDQPEAVLCSKDTETHRELSAHMELTSFLVEKTNKQNK